jgi:hypothetical protein
MTYIRKLYSNQVNYGLRILKNKIGKLKMKKTMIFILLVFSIYNSAKSDSLAVQELWRSGNPNPGSTFSHDSKFLYFNRELVYKMDAISGEYLDTLHLDYDSPNSCLNVLPGDSVMAMVYNRHIAGLRGVIFYNLNNNSFFFLDSNQFEGALSLSFNKDYSKFVTYNTIDNTYYSYITKNLKRVCTFKGYNGGTDNLCGWVNDSTFLSSSSYAFRKYNTNTGILISYGGTSFETKGTGITLSPDGNFLVACCPSITDPSKGKFVIYRTSDFSVYKEITNKPIAGHAFFDKTCQYLFLTYRDNTDIYEIISENTKYKFNEVITFNLLNDSNDLLYSDGGFMYKLDWDRITTVEENKDVEILYPNPTNNVLNLSQNIVIPQNYSLKIISLNGQVIREIINTFIAFGQFNQNIDVSYLQSGFYFLVLEGNNFTKTWKIIKE